jgi:DNA-binding response OmpR family regulator
MSKTVLVADDDPAILEVIKIILEEHGYKVITVSDGGLVRGEILSKKPSLVLLDIWMSGHDGRDITKLVKADKQTQKVPIVVISAHNETGKIAKEAGADNFLSKPFNIDELLSMVKQYA